MENAGTRNAKLLPKPTPDTAQAYRDRLVSVIEREAANTAFWTGRDHFAPAVLDAIARVPRHAFIPQDSTGAVAFDVAYANHPQPIGQGQTISQPYIVALMTDMLNLTSDARVLEIGTGCGYQCAVLAELVTQVYSIERLAPLAQGAEATLQKLGYTNTTVHVGDGSQGWADHAPYDGILVTACCEGPIPQPLIEHLARAGRMVIPLGPRHGPQMLHLGVKDADGRFSHIPFLMVSFVPLVTTAQT